MRVHQTKIGRTDRTDKNPLRGFVCLSGSSSVPHRTFARTGRTFCPVICPVSIAPTFPPAKLSGPFTAQQRQDLMLGGGAIVYLTKERQARRVRTLSNI